MTERKIKSWVDYMLSGLIYDKVRKLQRFVARRGLKLRNLIISHMRRILPKNEDICYYFEKSLQLRGGSLKSPVEESKYDAYLFPMEVLGVF